MWVQTDGGRKRGARVPRGMGSGREAGSVALTDAHGPSCRSLNRLKGEWGDHEGAGCLRAPGGAWEVTSSRHYAGSAVCCGLGGARAWGEGRSRSGRASRAKAGSIRRRSARPWREAWSDTTVRCDRGDPSPLDEAGRQTGSLSPSALPKPPPSAPGPPTARRAERRPLLLLGDLDDAPTPPPRRSSSAPALRSRRST
jgi:hypothetical protein